MRDKAGSHKFIHVSRNCRKFHISHIGCKLICFLLCCCWKKHQICTGQGRVANIMEFIQRYIREHSDIDCILHIDSAADTTSNINIINHGYIEIQWRQHGTDCWENCAFCTDEVVNIYFCDLDIFCRSCFFFKCDHITSHSIMVVTDSLSFTDKFALWIDNSSHIKFTDHINDTWST